LGLIHYRIEIEISEGHGCEVHKAGDRYRYPEDIGSLCGVVVKITRRKLDEPMEVGWA